MPYCLQTDSAARDSLKTRGNAVGKWHIERGPLDPETHAHSTVLKSSGCVSAFSPASAGGYPGCPNPSLQWSFPSRPVGCRPDQQGSSFQPLLPLGRNVSPALVYSGGEAGMMWLHTGLSGGILPRLAFLGPSALSLSLFSSRWKNVAQCRVLCPRGASGPSKTAKPTVGPAVAPARGAPSGGQGVAWGWACPSLGSRLPWPTSSQALAHFRSAGHSQTCLLRNRSEQSGRVGSGAEMASCLIFSRL